LGYSISGVGAISGGAISGRAQGAPSSILGGAISGRAQGAPSSISGGAISGRAQGAPSSVSGIGAISGGAISGHETRRELDTFFCMTAARSGVVKFWTVEGEDIGR